MGDSTTVSATWENIETYFIVSEFSLIVLCFYEYDSVVTIDNYRFKTFLLSSRIPPLLKSKLAALLTEPCQKDRRNPHQVVRQVLCEIGNYFERKLCSFFNE